MEDIALGLVVIRTEKVEASLAFYRALGLTFVEERHGSGLLHHACQLGTLVFEIYPVTAQQPTEGRGSSSTLLGFNVASLDRVLTALRELDVQPLNPPKATVWGVRAVVVDPDGRAMELMEPTTPE